ncbi:MAG: response regulator [Planctomycetota bacterium]
METQHRILLVDDDFNLLRGLSRALRQQPYEILTARSADEAKDVVQRWPVSLVVSDEQMPGMSGTDFMVWIAKHCPDVVRIVLTGHGTPETAIKAINEGQVFKFFTKPCNAFELGMAIRKGLEAREEMLSTHAV